MPPADSPAAAGPAGTGGPAGGAARPGGGGHGSGGMRAVLAALAANLGIAATKLVAALITGSASMLAESVHSIADSGNQVLLLVGRRRSRRAETEEHQFGFGMERYFYAFIVAVVLFTVGALFSIYEGWHRITHPAEVVSPLVALAVLGVAIILESASLRTALAQSKEARESAASASSSAGPRRPSCRPCCWRIWPRWPGWRSRWPASR